MNEVEGVGFGKMGLIGGLRGLEKVFCMGGGIVLGIGGFMFCPMVWVGGLNVEVEVTSSVSVRLDIFEVRSCDG